MTESGKLFSGDRLERIGRTSFAPDYLARNRWAFVCVVLGGLLVTGCASSGGDSELPKLTISPSAVPDLNNNVGSLTGVLNYDGLRSDGLCQGGGKRPCFAPIRKTPHFSAANEDPTKEYLNPGTFIAAGNPAAKYVAVSWPYEAGEGKSADQLTTVCRVIGDDVYGFDNAVHSTIWDVVVVPAEHSRYGVTTAGYVPERWMQLPHGLILGDCSTAVNPIGAVEVHSPTP